MGSEGGTDGVVASTVCLDSAGGEGSEVGVGLGFSEDSVAEGCVGSAEGSAESGVEVISAGFFSSASVAESALASSSSY